MEKKEHKKAVKHAHHHAEKTHGKSSHPESEMEEGLRAIYGEEPKDLHVVDRGASPMTYWLTRIVLGLFAVVILTISGLYLFSRGVFTERDESPLVMSVVVPNEVVSGERVTIEVPYENPKSIPIASLEIDVNVPASFAVTSYTPEPTNADELVFSVGSLGQHSDGKILIEGIWLGAAGSITNVQAIANYRPGNFNAIFSSIASTTVSTTSSVLTETLEGPATAIPGESVTYKVTLHHGGEEVIPHAEVHVAMPTGFILTTSTPALEAGAAPQFLFENIAPGEDHVMTLTGTFSSDASDVQQITAEAILKEGTRELSQAKAVAVTDVKGGDIRLSVVANGLTGKVSVEPGSTLSISYRIENAGTVPLTDATVLLDFQPEKGVPLVWSSASLDGGTLTKDGVKFDAAKIGILAPGDKKTFNLAFPIKSTFAEGDLDAFTISAHAGTGAGAALLSTPIAVNVSAAVSLTAVAHYYSTDGAAIGQGPMPPVVNEETTYEIMWTIPHALHALEDLVVTASLPPGVIFKGDTASDMGAVTYDEVNRTVRFEATGIPEAAGAIHAKFFVGATPGGADEGTFMKILASTSLRVTDTETGARIDKLVEALTTELPSDSFAANKGTVSAP